VRAYGALEQQGRPVRVVAAVDAAPGRAEAFAAQHGIGAAFDDLERALALDDVTAVHVCTSNTSHCAITVAAARAGKHVFVEKPIALSLDDADTMIEACEASGVHLMVGQSLRFEPVNKALVGLVRRGEIGRLVHVSTTNWSGYFWPGGWRAWQIDRSRSGGNLVQNGIHDLDLFCWLVGEAPVRVFARGLRLASAALDTFDHYHMQLDFPSGATALSSYGYSAVPPDAALRTLYAVGEEGEARYESTADGAFWTSRGLEHDPLPGPGLFEHEVEHWVDCLEHDTAPMVRPEQARLALELALAAEHSAHTGEPVLIGRRNDG
jgi:predicted dehydrogenase